MKIPTFKDFKEAMKHLQEKNSTGVAVHTTKEHFKKLSWQTKKGRDGQNIHRDR